MGNAKSLTRRCMWQLDRPVQWDAIETVDTAPPISTPPFSEGSVAAGAAQLGALAPLQEGQLVLTSAGLAPPAEGLAIPTPNSPPPVHVGLVQEPQTPVADIEPTTTQFPAPLEAASRAAEPTEPTEPSAPIPSSDEAATSAPAAVGWGLGGTTTSSTI